MAVGSWNGGMGRLPFAVAEGLRGTDVPLGRFLLVCHSQPAHCSPSWPRLTLQWGGRNEIQPGNCSRPDLIYCWVAGVHMAEGAKSSLGH